jgi:hypothetical protein
MLKGIQMGELKNQITAAQPLRSGKQGILERVLESLPESDRLDLIEALQDSSIPAAVIARVMQQRGIQLRADAITRYRRGEVAYVPE